MNKSATLSPSGRWRPFTASTLTLARWYPASSGARSVLAPLGAFLKALDVGVQLPNMLTQLVAVRGVRFVVIGRFPKGLVLAFKVQRRRAGNLVSDTASRG